MGMDKNTITILLAGVLIAGVVVGYAAAQGGSGTQSHSWSEITNVGNSVCFDDAGAASSGCPASSQFQCEEVYDGTGSGFIAVDVPAKCLEGTCSVLFTATYASFGNTKYGQGMYTQFESHYVQDERKWVLARSIMGIQVSASYGEGLNGDSTDTALFTFDGIPDFCALYDDGAAETNNNQWTVRDEDPFWNCKLWVC